ncbi:hypothetical protein [Nocardioides sp.]|uniref:hypothetical protein n=1 Tax=Nocardioides sp. TaxID=35761 RepID=UPI0039E54C6F
MRRLAAVVILTALALAGCGTSDPAAEPEPTPAATTEQPTEATTTPTDESATGETSPTGQPIESTTSTPVGTDSAAPAPQLPARLSLPVTDQSLPGAPAGLLEHAREVLQEEWSKAFGNDPACRGIATATVAAISDRGFASVDLGYDGEPGDCEIEGYGGGLHEVWAVQDGRWSSVYGGQEPPTCKLLQRNGVPRDIEPQCFKGGQLVDNPVS